MDQAHGRTSSRIEQILAITALALIVVGCLVVLGPFVSALLWAAIVCYCTWPFYSWLHCTLGVRKNLAASIMLLLAALVLVGPLVLVGVTLAENVTRFIAMINGLSRDGLPHVPFWVAGLPWFGDTIDRQWRLLIEHPEQIGQYVQTVLNASSAWLLQRGVDLGHGILQMTLSVLISFFFYRDGERVVLKISDGVKRIAGEQTQHLLQLVGQTVKGVVYGLIGTALAQGVLAALGFWIAGLPSPLFLGLVTFFLALIPFGPTLIWVPAALYAFTRSFGWGIFVSVWGILVVSGVDNVLRPYLISRGANLSFVLVLLGVLGGVIAFGFIGLFLGPTLLAVGYSLVDDWSSSRTPPAAPRTEAVPPASRP